MKDSAMKGYIELTDSLGNRCTLKATTTHIQVACPCHDLYVKESYEDVLKMMEGALEQ
ncbi:hypothetical protein [Bacteroides cellulosilyticus]|uniref:hypothetical protein n=1 Tax=Bacteroides cellulosilyticus TaxID=246787 RepID=UPI00189821AB|nr:hypothetical protein [Bacteroides cellulosilyticus]